MEFLKDSFTILVSHVPKDTNTEQVKSVLDNMSKNNLFLFNPKTKRLLEIGKQKILVFAEPEVGEEAK